MKTFKVPISLVRSDGVIFPYEQENFTYCPEPEESTALPVSCSPSVKRQRLDQEIHGMSEMANGNPVSVSCIIAGWPRQPVYKKQADRQVFYN
jgi:hypothetical protein